MEIIIDLLLGVFPINKKKKKGEEVRSSDTGSVV